MAPTGYVSYTDAAARVGMNKSHFFRLVAKLGLVPIRYRDSETGQTTNAISDSDLAIVLNYRQQPIPSHGVATVTTVPEMGWFYLILPIPECSRKRIKLGYTDDIDARKLSYMTLCPSLEVVKTWPCKRHWEKAIIAQAITHGCDRIGVEVFDVPSIEFIVDRLDRIFALFTE